MKKFLTMLCLALATIPVWGQTPPQTQIWFLPGRYEIRDQGYVTPPALLSGPQGLYLLSKGVVARLNPETLTGEQFAEPFGPLVDLPATPPPGGGWDLIQARTPRVLAGAMALQGKDLMVLIGDQFARANPATLAMAVNVPLVKNPLGRVDSHLFQPPPTLEFNGTTLYTIFLQSFINADAFITAVDTTTGEVIEERQLPKALNPDRGTWRVPGGPTIKNGYQLYQQPSCTWKATPDGIFLLRFGTLGKLDPDTLDDIKITALQSPVNSTPDDAAPEAKQSAAMANLRLYLPASMFVRDKDILVVQGDQFFRVDKTTLAVLKQTDLVPVDPDLQQQQSRLEQLIAFGGQQVQLTDQGLVVSRGTEVVVVDPDSGRARALKLPEIMTRPLTATMGNRFKMKPLALENDAKITGNGVIWPVDEAAGRQWYFYCPNYGEFLLTGDRVAQLVELPGATAGQCMLTGTFTRFADGAKRPGLGTLEITATPLVFQSLTVNGRVHQLTLPGGDVWVITGVMFEGEEYVLTGAKAKELAATPELATRNCFITGTFSRQNPKVPAFGRGYLEVTSFNAGPTPKESANLQDLARPVTVTTTANSMYVSRNGVVARYDAGTLEQQAVRELVPAVPVIPVDTAVTMEQLQNINANITLRTGSVGIWPQGQDVIVLSQSAGFFRLNAATLEMGAQAAKTAFPPAQCLLVDHTLYAVQGKKILAINAQDGTVQKSVDLPDKLTHRIFPDRVPPAR